MDILAYLEYPVAALGLIGTSQDAPPMDILAYLQYPGAALGFFGAWLVSRRQTRFRRYGFGVWIISNLCWIIYALSRPEIPWGLLAMFLVYCGTSVMGWMNNREPTSVPESSDGQQVT